MTGETYTAMSIFDELEKLESLHNRGVIDDGQYERGKARILSKLTSGSHSTPHGLQNFRRSRRYRFLGGICGALAERTGIPSLTLRVIACLLFYVHWIVGLIYLLLWIFVPSQLE